MAIKTHVKNLHTLRQYVQKYMCKYSEFSYARDLLPEVIPGCAGFVLGLSPVCLLLLIKISWMFLKMNNSGIILSVLWLSDFFLT